MATNLSFSTGSFGGQGLITVFNTNYNIRQSISIKEFVEQFIDNESDVLNKQIAPIYLIESYDYYSHMFEETPIIGIIKRRCTDKLIKLTIKSESILVSLRNKFMALDIRDLVEVTAMDLFENPTAYKITAGKFNTYSKIDNVSLVVNPTENTYCIRLNNNFYFKMNDIVVGA